MRFSVLGPLEVRVGDADRTPTALMPRRVLAMLLLHANRAVPVATLVDELWQGDELPRLARKTVQTYIYQLRKALGRGQDGAGDVIVSRPQAYQISLEHGELDLWDFDRLAEEGRDALTADDPARAADLLHRAVRLWRGRALADLAPGPLLSIEIARLEDRYVNTLELRIDADLRLGRHREVVGELEALTASHPMHEAFYAHLMVAAYRCGHRREALEAYHRLRRQMIDELGIEPSERLQQLQREILVESSSLDATPHPAVDRHPVVTGPEPFVPAQLPPDINGFIGRVNELRLIRSCCLVEPTEDRTATSIVAVVGQPGIGKSTLVVRAAHRMRRSFRDGQLFAVLHDPADRPIPPAAVLATFLSAAGFPPERIPRTLVERANLFRTWAVDRELLIVLDDAATVEQVLPLLPAGGGCAVLITARNRLAGLPGVTTIQLDVLGEDEGVALLTDVVGPSRIIGDLAAACRIVRYCQGLPLAVRAAGEKLAARPPWSVTKLADRLRDDCRCLDELRTGELDVRDRMLRSWRRLDRRDREAMRALCGIGQSPFNLSTAGGVLGLDQQRAESRVGCLVESSLLAMTGTTADGMAWFRFPRLLRLAVLDADPGPDLRPLALRSGATDLPLPATA